MTAPLPPSPQRRDIEGMRAVAVGVVVADHLTKSPPGGFVGVDIFFVISGFLISGILIREVSQTHRISFREFYARRARRILPAALVTILVTCIAARLIFFDSRAQQTYVDGMWAALSLANWHLAATGTDYFQSTLPPSAMQQFWSLSVEEQFYLAWPVIILMTGLVTRRLGLSLRKVLLSVLTVVVIASIVWGWWQTPRATTVAYFSTFTRAWELGAGGLLALLAPRLAAMPRWLSAALAWLGMIGVAVATVITRPDATFPVPGALLAVGSTLLVIGAGCSTRALRNPLLENPVAGFIGRISYSVYLWHWPIVIMSASLLDPDSPARMVWCLALTLVISTASFYWIEKPIRQTTWLSRVAPDRRRGMGPRMRRGYSAALAAAACAAIVLTFVPAAPSTAGQAMWPDGESVLAAPDEAKQPGSDDELDAQQAASIDQAVDATTWPALSPSLDQLVSSRVREWADCGKTSVAPTDRCRFGNESAGPDRTAVVLGDSIAISWLPAIREALKPDGWLIHGLTMGECPAARIDVVSSSKDQGFTEACAAHQAAVLDYVLANRPALVVISTTDGVLDRIVGADDRNTAADIYAAAQTQLVTQLRDAQVKVVVLSPPPARADLVSCATRVSVPEDCLTEIGNRWRLMNAADQSVMAGTGTVYVDTAEWTCSRSGECPAFIGNTPVMADGSHFTDAMSRSLAPFVKRAILG